MEQAIEIKTPTIGSLIQRNKSGDIISSRAIEIVIMEMLMQLNEAMNLKRPMSADQVQECAMLIVDEFKNLTIADIQVIFRGAKSGKYGEMYESLSMVKIMGWFRKYFEERCQYFQRRNQSDHEYKKNHGSNEVLQIVKKEHDKGMFKLPESEKKKKDIPYTLDELKKKVNYQYKEENEGNKEV